MAIALVTASKLKQAAGEMWVTTPCLQPEDPLHSLCVAPAQSALYSLALQSRGDVGMEPAW